MDEHLQRAVQDEVADAGNDVFACQPLNDFCQESDWLFNLKRWCSSGTLSPLSQQRRRIDGARRLQGYN